MSSLSENIKNSYKNSQQYAKQGVVLTVGQGDDNQVPQNSFISLFIISIVLWGQ